MRFNGTARTFEEIRNSFPQLTDAHIAVALAKHRRGWSLKIPPYVVADENIPGEVVQAVRSNLGCKVYWIAAEKPGIRGSKRCGKVAASRSALRTSGSDIATLSTTDQGRDFEWPTHGGFRSKRH